MKTFKTIEHLIRFSDIPYEEIYKRAEKHFTVTYKKGTLPGSVIAKAQREEKGAQMYVTSEYYPNTNCAEYNEYNYV